jgi:hypothetical protein
MRLIRSFVLVATIVLSAVVTADAHFTQPKYSYKTSGCQGPTDPVSLVYYGDAARSVRTVMDIKKHLGWTPRNASGQYIRDHGDCRGMYTDPADGPNDKTRYHVRIWGMQSKDTKGRWETVGTPHHEDWIANSPGNPGCGLGKHAVDKGAVDTDDPDDDTSPEGSGFDQGRRKIRQKVNTRQHDIKFVDFRNTQSFIQCDGDPAGSNGNVLWVSMGRH